MSLISSYKLIANFAHLLKPDKNVIVTKSLKRFLVAAFLDELS